jgi:FAD dependent oxidoreductase TIGR03364
MPKSAIVVGAGIAGLATARALAIRGYDVVVIERTGKAVGASIRNFGMIWPIGQPGGELLERAMLSKNIWIQVCREAGIGFEEVGSLHCAYRQDEWDVIQEFENAEGKERQLQLLNPQETRLRSNAIVKENLIGSLFSATEIIIDPREAIAKIPQWLAEKYGVKFIWGQAVTDICYPCLYAGKQQFEADEIYVCSGADFETLYPEVYSTTAITKCKLQMMRMTAQPGNWRLGPALCGGLTLIHYKSFSKTPSFPVLKERLDNEYHEYIKWGIHVMVSQNLAGELTVGDSHEYGMTHDPFDKHFINELILSYLKTFARFEDETIIQTWNGIYPKLINGETDLIFHPEQGVTVINGLGGAGMTLSFGLCEQLIAKTNG